jgi:hypothetical protein
MVLQLRWWLWLWLWLRLRSHVRSLAHVRKLPRHARCIAGRRTRARSAPLTIGLCAVRVFNGTDVTRREMEV